MDGIQSSRLDCTDDESYSKTCKWLSIFPWTESIAQAIPFQSCDPNLFSNGLLLSTS